MNNVALVGNLASDPKLGEANGTVVNFRLAVNRRRVRASGEEDEEERADFIDVECWGSQAENISASLKRGDRAIVAGQLKQDQWTNEEGNRRSRLRIRATAVGPSLEFQSIA